MRAIVQSQFVKGNQKGRSSRDVCLPSFFLLVLPDFGALKQAQGERNLVTSRPLATHSKPEGPHFFNFYFCLFTFLLLFCLCFSFLLCSFLLFTFFSYQSSFSNRIPFFSAAYLMSSMDQGLPQVMTTVSSDFHRSCRASREKRLGRVGLIVLSKADLALEVSPPFAEISSRSCSSLSGSPKR
jgi:hypothetical protein